MEDKLANKIGWSGHVLRIHEERISGMVLNMKKNRER
jgi:hypothetical protein